MATSVKRKKKITWLAQPTAEAPLIDVTLLDYDYLITKKKLEEGDDLKDFVPPITEFRTEAYADANVSDLKKGDIMQFERKGYYIFDGAIGEGDAKRLEFIHIPDGKQASLVSKAGAAELAVAPANPKEKAAPTSIAKGLGTPVDTNMYNVKTVYGDDVEFPKDDIKMYNVKNIYTP